MQPDYQPKTSRFRNPRFWIITFLVTSTVVAVAGIGIYIYRLATAPNCLNADDYYAFHHNEPVDITFRPGAEFFRGTYTFVPDTSHLNEADLGSDRGEDISNLAAFYKKHSRKPMLFVIETFYSETLSGSRSIAEQRATHIQNLLVDAGAARESTQVKLQSRPIHPSEDIDGYDETNTATLSLKSADSCRE